MKKTLIPIFIAIGLIFAPAEPVRAADCTWAPVTGASRSVVGSGAVNCTLTVATATSTFGMNLSGVGAFSVKVCAATGETITTLFTLIAYTMDPWSGTWSRDTQWDIAGGAIGDLCQVVGGWSVPGPVGRIAYVPSAGAVSSGSITIRMIASSIAGERL